MIFCSQCQHENRDNARFCAQCGAAVVESARAEVWSRQNEPSFSSDSASRRAFDPNDTGPLEDDVLYFSSPSMEEYDRDHRYDARSRKRRKPNLASGKSSWEMLGTNLSVQLPDGSWTTEPERLLLMDQRDFNRLGVGLDDLIEGYLQSVLALTAIDEMAQRLISKKKTFRRRLFRSLNPDQALLDEICK